MQIFKKEIPFNTKDKVITIRAAEAHILNPLHADREFDNFVEEQVADKNSYCIFPGDFIEDDRPSTRLRRAGMFLDRREAWGLDDKQHMTYLDQKVIPMVKRMAPRCLGMLDGDHFKMYSTGLTSTQYICMKAGIPYLGERGCWMHLLFTAPWKSEKAYNLLFKLVVVHGNGAGQTYGADVNKLNSLLETYVGADLIIAGHTHKLDQVKNTGIDTNKNGTEMVFKTRGAFRCGSFLKSVVSGDTSYAERAGYRPLPIGYGSARLHFSRNHNGAYDISKLEIVT